LADADWVAANKPLTWPCLAAIMAITGQGLWLALFNGTPCNEFGLLSWLPLALAVPAGLGEARAARLRGHGPLGIACWGIASAVVTALTGFAAGSAAAVGGGCFS
jgi:hypothetical protein